jgi:hypothetical protein
MRRGSQYAAIIATCKNSAHRTSRAARNTSVKHATGICNMRPATCSVPVKRCNMQQPHATCNMRLTPCDGSVRDATGSMQHAARDTQQETRRIAAAGYAEHETLAMQAFNLESARRRNANSSMEVKTTQCMQDEACSMNTDNYAACNTQNGQNATDCTHPAPGSMQHAALHHVTSTCNKHHATCKTDTMHQIAVQHVIAICNMQD